MLHVYWSCLHHMLKRWQSERWQWTTFDRMWQFTPEQSWKRSIYAAYSVSYKIATKKKRVFLDHAFRSSMWDTRVWSPYLNRSLSTTRWSHQNSIGVRRLHHKNCYKRLRSCYIHTYGRKSSCYCLPLHIEKKRLLWSIGFRLWFLFFFAQIIRSYQRVSQKPR